MPQRTLRPDRVDPSMATGPFAEGILRGEHRYNIAALMDEAQPGTSDAPDEWFLPGTVRDNAPLSSTAHTYLRSILEHGGHTDDPELPRATEPEFYRPNPVAPRINAIKMTKNQIRNLARQMEESRQILQTGDLMALEFGTDLRVEVRIIPQ